MTGLYFSDGHSKYIVKNENGTFAITTNVANVEDVPFTEEELAAVKQYIADHSNG